jgi:regulator of sirC expression with transglutaminase-like and TPR domain
MFDGFLNSAFSHQNQSIIQVYRHHAARAIEEERWSSAEIFLDKILEENPRHTEAWLIKGIVRQHCKDDEETAVNCFKKVISLCGHDRSHPHVRRAQNSLGRILRRWA